MEKYDVVVVGTGVAGSVTAMILGKLGYKTLMVEKGAHPRFALGESSTPIMSRKIRQLGQVYGIPELEEISSYDRIMASDRPFLCGPKELFQYFLHDPGQTEAKSGGEYREIMVQVPEIDSQFLRGELDERLVKYAKRYGAEYVDTTELLDADFHDERARLRLQKKDRDPYEIETKFLIDATGFRSLLARKFDLRVPENELDTSLRSRCIFTHFETVGRLEDAVDHDETFDRRTTVDRVRATQHHCFEGGWYWFIPFDNGVTSVGVNLDMDLYPMNDLPAEEEFWEITRRYPIVHKMLEGRKPVMPYIKTGRLQFRTRYAAGDRWALLPAAAVGADAYFSTGMGLNMVAIHRLVDALHTRMFPTSDFRRQHLLHYEQSLFKEWSFITRMVDGVYKSFKHWEVFKSYCYVFFMGAESSVMSGGIFRQDDPGALMLNAGDPEFVDHFQRIYAKVLQWNKKDRISPEEAEYLRFYVRSEMMRFNLRDYGNPDHQGVYYRMEPYHGVQRTSAAAKKPEMSSDATTA